MGRNWVEGSPRPTFSECLMVHIRYFPTTPGGPTMIIVVGSTDGAHSKYIIPAPKIGARY